MRVAPFSRRDVAIVMAGIIFALPFVHACAHEAAGADPSTTTVSAQHSDAKAIAGGHSADCIVCAMRLAESLPLQTSLALITLRSSRESRFGATVRARLIRALA